MPKGTAKGRIVPVRFTADDLKAMAAGVERSFWSVGDLVEAAA